MMVGTELAKGIQEIKRASGPNPVEDKDKEKGQEGQGPVEDQRRRSERGCRQGGHCDRRHTLAEPLQPRAPARDVAGWCRDQSHAIHVRNPGLPQTYTQQNPQDKTREEKQSQWLGEGKCRRNNRARRTHMSTQGPRSRHQPLRPVILCD